MPLVRNGSHLASIFPELSEWMARINDGVQNGYGHCPFLAYGTDWLAFIGPLRDPIKNRWVIEFGMMACLLVIPWTLIFGTMRGIPFFWQLIDMSFGRIGMIPSGLARREILKVAAEL